MTAEGSEGGEEREREELTKYQTNVALRNHQPSDQIHHRRSSIRSTATCTSTPYQLTDTAIVCHGICNLEEVDGSLSHPSHRGNVDVDWTKLLCSHRRHEYTSISSYVDVFVI